MAMIAACTLDPGVYLAMNIKVPGPTSAAVATATVTKVNSFGPEFVVTENRMTELAGEVKEETLYGRTGGAATLAVGMANLFSKLVGGKWLGIWYHFALMFEALFILTTLDAGTRVGRYLLQDALGHISKPLGNVRSLTANLFASALVVGAWGYFLVAAVYDPDGGIKALWPIFGIANQLLAATALCLATTIILKMSLGTPACGPTRTEDSQHAGSETGAPLRSPAFALVTLIPLFWLLAVTGTAAVQKIWHPDPRIGFLAGAKALGNKAIQQAKTIADGSVDSVAVMKTVRATKRQMRNLQLDAAVTAFFLALVVAIFLISVREWILLLARKKLSVLRETEPTWLPDYAIAEAKPLHAAGLLALSLALLREISGEAKVDRAQQHCACEHKSREHAYLKTAEERYNGINRCC
jgi:carbon starvation protein